MATPRRSSRKREGAATEAHSIRVSKRLRENEDNDKPQFPELPDDILRIIFNNLSTDDRVSLGSVSRRFRSIDLDIGRRKFKEISVFYDFRDGVHIVAALSTYRYKFHATDNEQINEIVPHNFFKNSSAHCLSIFVDKNVKVEKLLDVHSLFNTFHFKEIYLQFDSSINILDVLNRFLSGLLSNVGELKDVTLVWENLKNINLEDLRIALRNIPEMEKISLEIPEGEEIGHLGNIISYFPYFVCDGKTMIHLIKNSNNADLGSVECTAQELFEAFQIFCDSKSKTKRATLLVLQSIVDELFAIAEQRPGLFMESASCGSDPPMRWSSVYGEAPDRRSEQERESDHLAVAEKFVAQRIRLKQHYGWPERDVIPMKSLSGWSALVRFQARAAMKPVVRLQDYESKVTTAAAHGYGSPVSRKPDGMDASDESCSASSRTARRRVRPPELSTP